MAQAGDQGQRCGVGDLGAHRAPGDRVPEVQQKQRDSAQGARANRVSDTITPSTTPVTTVRALRLRSLRW